MAVATLSYGSSGSVCAHTCVLCVLLCVWLGNRVENSSLALSQFKATSSREMPVKAQLQDSMIARCLDVELHSLVPFLIDGFVFAMPGSKARMNLTAHLHAFAE